MIRDDQLTPCPSITSNRTSRLAIRRSPSRLIGQVVNVVARELHALNGLMIFTPSMSAPCCMSSESSRVTPASAQAASNGMNQRAWNCQRSRCVC